MRKREDEGERERGRGRMREDEGGCGRERGRKKCGVCKVTTSRELNIPVTVFFRLFLV